MSSQKTKLLNTFLLALVQLFGHLSLSTGTEVTVNLLANLIQIFLLVVTAGIGKNRTPINILS